MKQSFNYKYAIAFYKGKKRKYNHLTKREIIILKNGRRRGKKVTKVIYRLQGEIIAYRIETADNSRLFFRVPYNALVFLNALEVLGVNFKTYTPFVIADDGTRFKQGLFYERIKDGYKHIDEKEFITE